MSLGRGPGDARRVPAPEPGASGPRRIAGALVLVLVVSAILAAAHRSWKEGLRRSRFRPPFRPVGARAFRSDGSLWRMDEAGPSVVIYVERACPHCAAELREWEERLTRWPGPGRPSVRVVAPRPPEGGRWLPASLRGRVLHDSAGSTARALGVEVVPTTAYLSSGGVVVALERGRTERAEAVRLVRRLLEREPDEGRP